VANRLKTHEETGGRNISGLPLPQYIIPARSLRQRLKASNDNRESLRGLAQRAARVLIPLLIGVIVIAFWYSGN
jgi:hypothetical protein